MKVLCVTNLFPDSTRPGFAPFNRQQLVHLASECELHLLVPFPWPKRVALALRGRAPAPPSGLGALSDVRYPTYWYTPKVGRGSYGRFYHRSIRGAFGRLVAEVRPDVVYATWAYPDCWAAAVAAERAGLPIVARVHGSDVNEYLGYPERRRLIVEGLRRARYVVAVSAALRDRLVEAGVDREAIRIVMNGVDRSVFKRLDRDAARRELGLSPGSTVILFAGNLERVKGIDLLIEAFGAVRAIGDVGPPSGSPIELHILGGGPESVRLRRLAARSGARDRILFHGPERHDRMGAWFNACDLFCLPSRTEGTPNVILEALACGAPVVASGAGGIPDILPSEAGIIFPPGDVRALESALREALGRQWDRARIQSPAGSWEESARSLASLLAEAARRG